MACVSAGCGPPAILHVQDKRDRSGARIYGLARGERAAPAPPPTDASVDCHLSLGKYHVLPRSLPRSQEMVASRCRRPGGSAGGMGGVVGELVLETAAGGGGGEHL